ncbi:MAG: hypothetical protein JW779_06650 [Candidatus Thorarchaeota archaeon]|nr:hypothetical protein [Candidatus Thorarchaeota archaeon]
MIIEGKIISSQLGEFGKDGILYGYLGIEDTQGNHLAIKIDSYSWYETLEIGEHVIIEASKLGTTNIIVARKISLKSNSDLISHSENVVSASS